MKEITFKGLNKLEKALKENVTLDDVKRVVRTHGAALQRNMQSKADFTQGYQTGTTKRSIGLEIAHGGFTANVGPETEYSPYLEYGTRFMAAQPFVGPALNEQKEEFNKDLQKLVR